MITIIDGWNDRFSAYHKCKVSNGMIYEKTILIKCRKELDVSFLE